MFDKLRQFIEQEGIGQSLKHVGTEAEKQSLKPQLTGAREQKKDTAYRLFYKYTTHLKAYGEYEQKPSHGNRAEYEVFLEEIGEELDPDISPGFELICSLSSKVFSNPDDQVPKTVKGMLSEPYRVPRDFRELWHHLLALVVYWALPVNSFPILTDQKMDIAACKLAYAVGRVTDIIRKDAGILFRGGASKEGKRVKIVEPVRERVREMVEVLSKEDPQWSSYSRNRKAEMIMTELPEWYGENWGGSGKGFSKKTIVRRLKEINGQT